MIRVYMPQNPGNTSDDNGIGRIVHAQYKYLPKHGIEFVESPDDADLCASHIEKNGLKEIHILHVHGLYYSDIPHAPYAPWHHTANLRIAAAAREARAITVPSPWVAETFRRDMRINPYIIPHGIDFEDWQPVERHGGYVLWNKNRPGDVCDPSPALALARAGVPVVSTFGPTDIPTLRVVGTQPHAAMRDYVRHAAIYLATTPETFGIGTLEAMASGVPILGYDWCGTADVVRNGVDGILVTPGDEAALLEGYHTIMRDRAAFSRDARERAAAYGWEPVMATYADLFHRVAEERKRQERVAVVVTNYNYGRYLPGALASLQAQAAPPDEIVIVDDGSTDGDDALLMAYEMAAHYRDDDGLYVARRAPVRVIRQGNQGVAAARNNGIAATDCEFVVCLDADDQLGPEYLKVCADALRRDRGLGIAYTGLGFLDERGNVAASPFPPPFDWAHQAQPTTPPATCVPTAAMFRRSLWERAGGYIQQHAPGEDAEFYTRGLSVGFNARKVSDDPLIWYRAHPGSASRTRQYKAVDTWHPWMRDGQYPFAAPSRTPVPVRSYALPVVSVVIPVGPGHARYLPAALDSLLGQTFRQWEVIVVDDGALGDTLVYYSALLSPYPFIRLVYPIITHEAGAEVGPSAARNLGLAAARAPLTLFLDADDWLLPGALEAMVRTFAEHGGARYVYGDAIAHTADGATERLRAPEYDRTGWWTEGADGVPLMHHSVTALVPTAAAREVGFDEALRGWEEQFFYADLAIRGVCGVRLPEPVIGYRVASGTVREASWDNSDALRALRRDRYARTITGEEPMAGCCGGNAIDYARARAALDEVQWSGDAPPPGMTLVRYTGKNLGTFVVSMERGVPLQGRYRFSAAPENAIQPVYDADVERLLRVGEFAVVDAPPPPPPAPIVADAQPTVATVAPEDEATTPDAPTKPMRRQRRG